MLTESRTVGGNCISQIQGGVPGEYPFAESVYTYKYYVLNGNDEISVGGPGSWTVFFYKTHDNSAIMLENNEQLLEGDSLEIVNRSAKLSSQGGKAEILVSGVTRVQEKDEVFSVTKKGDHYKVSKPWGHEIWFNGEHPDYCLKEVFVKAGNRTSLQYHNKKEETNVIISGKAKLFYKENDTKHNDDVVPEDLGTTELNPISIVHITPGVLHRIEALTDVLIFETSTPFLDDVIRVQDDSNRADGRIQAEHKQ